ncbi:hypothetical protein HOA64_02045, partial [bacterium]|nr:hypothetical protein [bacterium]MBT7772478.1 hypothetical protein [bacterium]
GGATSCSTVSTGYYTTGGTSTTRTGQSQCATNDYCVSGVSADCPANSSSPAGSDNINDCDGNGGYYSCADGTCNAVGTGYYSPNDNDSRTACEANRSTTGSGTGADAQTDCLGNAGYYGSDTGIAAAVAGAGYYSAAANNTRAQCVAGYYGSSTTNSISTCNGQCTANYYCGIGSSSATQNACIAGKVSPAGSDAIDDCVWDDADTNQNSCTGQGYDWNIGGEVDPTACCGDDGENTITADYATHGSIDSSPTVTDACCSSSNKCVHSNTCYASATAGTDVDSDGDTDYCLSGDWRDCSTDAQCDTANGFHCASGDCVAWSTNMDIGTASSVYDTSEDVELREYNSVLDNDPWSYKLSFEVDAAAYDRTDYLISMPVNFTQLFTDLGVADSTMCDDCFRVVEYSSTTKQLTEAKPARFLHPGPDYDATTNARGRIDFVLDGTTNKNTKRYFYLFFESTQNGAKGNQPVAFDNSQVFIYPETDLDGDGKMEIVAVDHDYGVEIIKWDGDSYETVFRQAWDMGTYPAIAIADTDGNGIPNLIVSYYSNGYMYSFEYNSGSGEYENTLGGSTRILDSGGNPYNVTVGDLDGDGLVEIIDPGYSADRSYVYGWTGSAYAQESTLDVVDPSYWNSSTDFTSYARQIDNEMMAATGDIDGDGMLEFISARYQSSGRDIWQYGGNNTYEHQEYDGSYYNYWGAAMLDVDMDGLPEFVSSDSGDGPVIFEYDELTGAWTRTLTSDIGHNYQSVGGLADWDGDGYDEFVVGDNGGRAHVFQYNPTTGAYEREWYSRDEGSNGQIAAFGDVDGDGTIEVLYPNGGSIDVYNSSSGPTNAAPEMTISPGNSSYGYYYSDSLLISGMPDPQAHGVGAPVITKGEAELVGQESVVTNTGANSITGYLDIIVEKYSGSWTSVTTVVSNSSQTIGVGVSLDLQNIWNTAGSWNTGSQTDGTYRVRADLKDSSGGTVMTNEDDSSPMTTNFEFEIDNGAPVISENTPSVGVAVSDPSSTEENTYDYTWKVETDELAVCRYHPLEGRQWADMVSLDTDYKTLHIHRMQLTDEQSYNFYIKCRDENGNESNEFNLNFTTEWDNKPTAGPTAIDLEVFDNTQTVTLSATCYDLDTTNATGDGMKECQFQGTQDGTTRNATDWKSCTGTSCSCSCTITSAGVGSAGCPDYSTNGDWSYRVICKDTAGNTDTASSSDVATRASVSWGSAAQSGTISIAAGASEDLTYAKTVTINNTESTTRSAGWAKNYTETLGTGVDSWSVYEETTCSGDLVQRTPFVAVVDRDGRVDNYAINGDGSFGAKKALGDIFLGNDDSLDAKVADMNGDGFYDIISGGDSDIQIYAGSAGGTFTKQYESTGDKIPGDEIRGFAVADFDNDGDYDIFAVNESEAEEYFRNDGSWTFTHSDISLTGPAGSYPTGMDAADFDKDGNMDAILAQYNDGTFIYFGNGDGTFAAPVEKDNDTWLSYGIAAADFTGDGEVDYIKSTGSGGDHYLYTNDGSENFTRGSMIFDTADYGGLTHYDFDGDDDQDVMMSIENAWGATAYVAWNNGTGTFTLKKFAGIRQYGIGYDYSYAVAAPEYDADIDTFEKNYLNVSGNSVDFDIHAKETDTGNQSLCYTWTNGLTASACVPVQDTGSTSVAGGDDFEKCTVTVTSNADEDADITLQDACAAGAGGSYTAVDCGNKSLAVTAGGQNSYTFKWKESAVVTETVTANDARNDWCVAPGASPRERWAETVQLADTDGLAWANVQYGSTIAGSSVTEVSVTSGCDVTGTLSTSGGAYTGTVTSLTASGTKDCTLTWDRACTVEAESSYLTSSCCCSAACNDSDTAYTTSVFGACTDRYCDTNGGCQAESARTDTCPTIRSGGTFTNYTSPSGQCTGAGVELDSTQNACTLCTSATAGAWNDGGWNLGGETAATACCGDDASEWSISSPASDGSMDGSIADSLACCNASTDCAAANVCTTAGAVGADVDGDGDTDYCSSGTWKDCTTDANCGASEICTANNCAGLTAPTVDSITASDEKALNSELGKLTIAYSVSGGLPSGYEYNLDEVTPTSQQKYYGTTASYTYDSTANTNYCFRVRIQDAASPAHYSSWSSTVCGNTADRTGYISPEITATADNANNEIDLSISEGDADLLLYLPFEEGSGTTANDWSVSKDDGTISSATYTTGNTGNGGALNFNGTSDVINIATASVGANDMTASFWMNPDNLINETILGSGSTYTRMVQIEDADTFELNLGESGVHNYYDITGTFQTGQWQHVAVTKVTDGDIKIYLNGEDVTQGSPTISNATNGAWNLVGSEKLTAGKYFDGSLDEVRVYDRALTQAEIVDDMLSGVNRKGVFQSETQSGTYAPVDGYYTDFIGTQGASINTLSNWTEYLTGGSTSRFTIDNDQLKMFNAGADASETYSGATYTLPTAVNTEVVKLEYDLTWSNSNSWNYSYRVWDSSNRESIHVGGNGTNWNVYVNGSGWDYNSVFTDGTTYHMTQILNFNTNNVRYYIDDVFLKEISFRDTAATDIKKIRFGNYGYDTQDKTYYVDNFQITPLISADVLTDDTATDQAGPNSPTSLSSTTYNTCSNDATPTVTWTDATDNGSDYFYYTSAYDQSGNVSNFVTNATFEEGISNWSSLSAVTVEQNTTSPIQGGADLHWVGNGTAYSGVASNAISFVSGETYRLSFTYRLASGQGPRIKIGKSSSPTSSALGGMTEEYLTNSSNTFYSQTFTATETSTAYVILFDSPTGAADFYVDNIEINKADSATVTTGVDGYTTLWDTGATTDPNGNFIDTGVQTSTAGTLGTGTYYFHIQAQDETPNWSGLTHYGPFPIDVTAPGVPTMTAEPAYTAGTTNTVASTTASDTGCNGTVQYQYCKNTSNSTAGCTGGNLGGWGTNSHNFTGLSGGQIYYYFVQTKDGLSNTSGWSSSTSSTQDASAPVITITDDASGSWAQSDTIAATIVDPNLSVSKWDYDADGTCSTTAGDYGNSYTSGNNLSVTTNHNDYICFYGEDSFGSKDTDVTGLLKVDVTDPTVTDDYASDGTWVDSNQTITLSPADSGGSAVADTKYCWGGSCTTSTGTVGTSIGVTANTNNTLRYQTWDNAGNSSTIGSAVVRVDKTDPTCGTWTPASGSVPWSSTTPQNFVLASSTDSGGSAIATAGGNCDETTHNQTCNVQISDNAGNTVNCASPNAKIDTVDPTGGSVSNTNGYQTSTTIAVSVTAGTDATSGMSTTDGDYLLEYQSATLSGGSCGSYGSWTNAGVTENDIATSYNYTATTDNCYKFRYTVADIAGNTVIWTGTDVIKIVDGVPTVSVDAVATWVDGNVALTADAGDTVAGLKDSSCQYSAYTSSPSWTGTGVTDDFSAGATSGVCSVTWDSTTATSGTTYSINFRVQNQADTWGQDGSVESTVVCNDKDPAACETACTDTYGAGTYFASKCCGDDGAADDWENTGTDNSVCINGAVVADEATDATGQYVNIDGEIYGCGGTLGGVASSDGACVRRLTLFCDGNGTGANTWKTQIANNVTPDDCDGGANTDPYGEGNPTPYDEESCVGNKVYNDGNGIPAQDQGWKCSQWYGPHIATCSLSQSGTDFTVYVEVADEADNYDTGGYLVRIGDYNTVTNTGAVDDTSYPGTKYYNPEGQTYAGADANEGTYGDYFTEVVPWASLITAITEEKSYYLEVGLEENTSVSNFPVGEDPNSNEGSCNTSATFCVPTGYVATADSDCCPIGAVTGTYPGKDDDGGACVQCSSETQVAGGTGDGLCESKCGSDSQCDEQTANQCADLATETTGWTQSTVADEKCSSSCGYTSCDATCCTAAVATATLEDGNDPCGEGGCTGTCVAGACEIKIDNGYVDCDGNAVCSSGACFQVTAGSASSNACDTSTGTICDGVESSDMCVPSGGCQWGTSVDQYESNASTSRDLDSDGDNDFCDSGTWKDCSTDVQCQGDEYCNGSGDCAGLNAPTGVTVTAQTDQSQNSSAGQIIVNWTGSLPTNYEYSLVETAPTSQEVYYGTTASTTLSELLDNQRFCYRVRVQDVQGSPTRMSAWSSTVCDITDDRDGSAVPSATPTADNANDEVDLSLAEGDDDLVLYLPFEEGSGTTANDWSANKNDGTITGATYTTGNTGNGGALNFDGSGDFIEVPDSADLDFGADDFTISAWFYRPSTPASYNSPSVNKWNTGASPGTNEFSLTLGSGGSTATTPGFIVESGTTTYVASSPDTTQNATWYHVTGVRDGGSLKIYVDGILKNENTNISTNAVNNVGRDLWSGKFADSPYYSLGKVDEVKIYKRALAQTEIINEMQSGVTRFGIDRSDTVSGTYVSILAGAVTATGGTITDDGEYRVHTFTSSGTFTPGAGLDNVEVLVVGGGGGGASSQASSGGGGGGGAGGLVYDSSYSLSGSGVTVTIGGGGAPGTAGVYDSGDDGVDSVFGTITAYGGGGGGTYANDGLPGGSGGGAGYNGYSTVRYGGSGTLGQGNAGGNTSQLSWAGGAGGGGAGGVGGDNKTGHAGGDGGAGLVYSLSGSDVEYAAGGGGGANSPSSSPANTGQGGDAAYAANTAYAGGDGVVVVRYLREAISADTYTDTTATDDTAPAAPSGLGGATTDTWSTDTTPTVTWTDGSDAGDDYFFSVSAYDQAGNADIYTHIGPAQVVQRGTNVTWELDEETGIWDVETTTGSYSGGQFDLKSLPVKQDTWYRFEFEIKGTDGNTIRLDTNHAYTGETGNDHISGAAWSGPSTMNSSTWSKKAVTYKTNSYGSNQMTVYHIFGGNNIAATYQIRNIRLIEIQPATVTTGLDGYATSWTHGTTDISSPSKNLENAIQTATSTALSDAADWYFNILPVDNAGNWATSTVTIHRGPFKIDTTAPIGGAVSNTNGYQTSTTISASVTAGTDATSGMSSTAGDYLLEYQSATLSGGSCGGYGSWTDASVSETSGATSYNFTATTGNCYKFRYTVEDVTGNPATWTGTDVTKVDTATPNIVAVDGGPSSSDRTELTSGTWFRRSVHASYPDLGGDDLASFEWTDPASTSDDTFYYELNTTATATIGGTESTVTTPYVDDITISEGTSYFHVRPKTGSGTWGTERIFTLKYDKTAPAYVGVSFTDCTYETGNDCWVTDGQTFYVNISHTDGPAGTRQQYLEFTKNNTQPGGWDEAYENIKTYAVCDGIAYGSPFTGYSEQARVKDDAHLDIREVLCDTVGGCGTSTNGKWEVLVGSGTSEEYGVTVYMYDLVDNGQGYTQTGKWVKLDNDVPTVTDNYADDGTWVDSAQSITLSPTDGSGSGLTATKYCWGASCDPATGTSGTTINVSVNTNNILRYQTWDNVGLASTISSIDVKIDLDTPDIVAVDGGASSGDRTSLTSGVLFDYPDTGSDDQVSFSWTDPGSFSDDNFYYELNTTATNTITGSESTVATPYVDNIAITTGTKYFHVRPRTGSGTWGTERIFTLNYNRCAPPASGNWTVTESCTISSENYTVNGDIIIDTSVTLRLEGTTHIQFSGTDRKVRVRSGAKIIKKNTAKLGGGS